jgi:multimeric flavodoxin WrbA
MKAVVINCTLKKSPEPSNTESLAKAMITELQKREVECYLIRAVDKDILPGVTSDEGSEDDWPKIRKQILASEILVLASPTWLGRHSSVAQRVLERLNGMFSEEDEDGQPVAYNHVAGFLATGNTDGAKHVIAEMMAALSEVGFTVPGQAWGYFNNGSAGGATYNDVGPIKQQRSLQMATTAAANLVAVARALEQNPIPPSPK